MNKTLGCVAVSLAALLALSAPAFAKQGEDGGHGKGHGNGKWDQGDQDDDHGPRGGYDHEPSSNVSINIHIGDDDRRIIRGYYDEHPDHAEHLPPGIAKNLARGKPLPPGIAKRYMPHELVTRLPPRPDCDWLVVGVNAVLIDRHSGLVVDIAADIFP